MALLGGGGMGGIASMLSNLLMIGALAFVGLWAYRKFFAKKSEAALAGAGAGQSAFQAPVAVPAALAPSQPAAFAAPEAASGSSAASAVVAPAAVTPTYSGPIHITLPNADAFVANAKTQYITLQSAWDKGDLVKLREMSTDGLFMDLAQQIANRKGAPNSTEVVSVDAVLTSAIEEAGDTVATIQFTGLLREDGAVQATAFQDTWTLTKPTNGTTGWLLAGVESV